MSAIRHKNNIYFYWWEFLRRNEGYVNYCENPVGPEYSQLYKDFGDVRPDDFESWWAGALQKKLFQPGDPPPDETPAVGASPAVEVIKNHPTHEELADTNFLYLKVSLHHSKPDLRGHFSDVLNTRHGAAAISYEKGRVVKYPLSMNANIKALKRLLEVYDFRMANPEIPLWKSALVLDINPDSASKDLKNVGASNVGRYLKKAKVLIENVGQGRFPDYHSCKPWQYSLQTLGVLK